MIWTPSTNAVLRYYWNTPLLISAIADTLGTTRESVTRQAIRLKLGRKKQAPRVWTTQRRTRLKQLWLTERTAADVARAMGLTEGAITAQAAELRLPHRTRRGPRRGACSVKWTKADLDKLLELQSRGFTGSQCAKILKRSRSAVLGKLHRLSHNSERLGSSYVPRVAG